MKKIYFLFFCMAFLNAFSQGTRQKYHRAKINYNSIEKYEQLVKLGLSMDHGTHKKGFFIISDFSDREIQLSRNLGLQVDIEIEDVQKYYQDQNKNTSTHSNRIVNSSCTTEGIIDYETPSNYSNGSMGGYLTYAQLLQNLDAMQAAYPDLISARENVGTFLTQENRAIQWVKITKNVATLIPRPQVLYTAIHHAREPACLSETIFYMWYLLENYSTNDEVKNILDNTELFFIPVVNPDGYVYNETTNPNGGGLWRKNRHDFGTTLFGVDDNRNYDYWVNGDSNQSVFNTTGVSADATGETYPGINAFSEPETQAVRYFVENHNFQLALNAHTYSNLLLYPFGYDANLPTPDDVIYQGISKMMVSQNGFVNEIASQLYSASGDSDDFMYGQTFNHNKIFAFTPEIGTEFWPAASEIIPICKSMVFTNLAVANMTLNYGIVKKDASPFYVGSAAVFNAGFSLTNYGLNGNGNFTVRIDPISSNISSVGPPISYTNMVTLQSESSSIPISFAAGTASGDDIIYDIVLNNGVYDTKIRVNKKFGALNTILTDSGNTIAPNFTSSNWGTTTEKFVTPTKSFTDSPNSDYNNNQTKSITLANPINLTTATGATITFNTQWDIENDWDYTQFQISTDNGVTWVAQCGKYTTAGSVNTNQPQGEPLYDGTQSTWVEEEIDLSGYLGQTVKARFFFKSDGGQTGDGFYFDDFKVNLLQTSVLSNVQNTISSYSIYPNPFYKDININTNLDDYSIAIYTIQGQLVFNKTNNDGRISIDLAGLNSGVYFVKIKSKKGVETKKIIKK